MASVVTAIKSLISIVTIYFKHTQAHAAAAEQSLLKEGK